MILETTAPASEFALGPVYVKPGSNELASQNTITHLEPRLMALLVILYRAQGEAVSRSTLLDQIWGANLGSDEVLTQSVSKLRKQLRAAHAPVKVETIPKIGYRLILPLTNPATTASASAPSAFRTKIGKFLVGWRYWLPVLIAAIMISVFLLAFRETTVIEIEIIAPQ